MINIYVVKDELQQKGWKLISDEYQNLRTPLDIMCPKGHKQSQTFEEWRHYCRCDVCLAGDKFKQRKNIPKKRDGVFRILGLDAATILTGYSLYDDKQLITYGVFKATETDASMRINSIKKWVMAQIEEWQPDLVGIENIQMQGNNPDMFKKLANLQGVLIDTMIEMNIKFKLMYSSEWRKVCGINGKCRQEQKQAAQNKVLQWYKLECSEDEADAICIGKYLINEYYNKKW